MSRLFLAFRSLVYASGFVLVWGWLALTVRPLDSRIPVSVPKPLQPFGVVLALLGASLALWCVAVFVTGGRGTPAPFDAPRRFVAIGPYRWVRNPMYIGGLGVLLGLGLSLGSPTVASLTIVGLALAHLFVLLYEEPTLTSRFGDTYAEYTGRVNRWLPRVPRAGAANG